MTAKEFLTAYGQDSARVNVRQSMDRFLTDMRKGLQGNGGMPMIPTYLTNIDRSKIKTNVKRILIDAGGTNFRVAIGYFDDNGKVVLTDLRKSVMPAADGKLMSKEAFYSAVADNLKKHLDKARDVGYCFSYQVDMDKDVDGTIVMFSKEINAPEVVGTRVGAETLAACRKYSDVDRKIVVLNDTVATLLGGMATSNKKYSAYLGYIYGTGTNVCYIEDTANIIKVADLPRGQMLINTECGNFEGFEMGCFDKTCIEATAVPNKQLFEKMASGKYLSNVIAEAFSVAKEDGCLAEDAVLAPFELKDVSTFLNGGAFPCRFNGADAAFAKDICRELIERAAKMGAIVNASIAVASCKDKSLPVAVVAEGTTFNKLTGYRSAFEDYLTGILAMYGMTYEIVQGEELNLVGSLMATMII